jgi:HAD superfamily hydrolase (TIGR01509 family)
MPNPELINVRAVIFDAGGTIVHPDWDRLARIADAVSGRWFEPPELGRAFGEMLKTVGIEMQQEGFVLPEAMQRPHWTFRYMYAALGFDESTCARIMKGVSQAHDERHLWCNPDPQAAEVLDELKQQGLVLAVISNTEDGRLTESLAAAGIADRFDLLIDSHVVGIRKPDPAIFELTLELLGIKAGEAAYVGDSYVHDALAARGSGLRGILLDPFELYPDSVCPRIKSLKDLCLADALVS